MNISGISQLIYHLRLVDIAMENGSLFIDFDDLWWFTRRCHCRVGDYVTTFCRGTYSLIPSGVVFDIGDPLICYVFTLQNWQKNGELGYLIANMN